MVDVSVIVPTHNRRRLLGATVESILRQQGVALELIIVDDGSTDGTGPWLDQIASAEPRLKIVRHARPRFVSGARNAGLGLARGRWAAFCDDDDLWAPDKLACQLAALRAHPARWGCTGVVEVDDLLEITGHYRAESGAAFPRLLEVNTLTTSSVIAETGFVREIGGFDPSLRGSEDWDLWIRLARHSPLAAVDRPLVAYRQGAQSLSMDVDRMRGGRAIIVERYAALAATSGARPDEASHERYLARQLLRAGSRARAAAIFASLAIKHRRWRELPVAAAALVSPRLTDRLGAARAASRVPPVWRRQAEAWLRPFRGETGWAGKRNFSGEVELEVPRA